MAKHGDKYIIFIIITIMAIGVVMVYSASHIYAFEKFKDSNYFLKKDIFAIIIGLIAFSISANIHYSKWRLLAFPLVFISILMSLSLYFIPSVSLKIGGAVRWIRIFGIFQFQPSEFSKLSLIIYLATLFSKKKAQLLDYSVAVIIVALQFFLIIEQPDFSTAFLVATIAATMLFFNGVEMSYLIPAFLIGVTIGLHYIREPYRWKRVKAFLDPWSDPYGSGYHIIHSLIAIGSGGLFGLGLGNSHQKFNYLPEPFTDFIFSIICEELGFIGASLLISLYIFLLYRIIKIVFVVKDKFSYLLLLGISCSFLLQILINIGVTLKMFPTTGIPLPLVSYGGSSLLINLTLLGIVYNISRQFSK